MLFLLDRLGFVVNQKKSMLIPSQKIEYLGFIINTGRLTLSLPPPPLLPPPPEKVTQIQEECRQVLQQRSDNPRGVTGTLTLQTPANAEVEGFTGWPPELQYSSSVGSGVQIRTKMVVPISA